MLIPGGKETNMKIPILEAIRVHAFRHSSWLEPSHIIHHRKGGAMDFFFFFESTCDHNFSFWAYYLFLTACPEQSYRQIH